MLLNNESNDYSALTPHKFNELLKGINISSTQIVEAFKKIAIEGNEPTVNLIIAYCIEEYCPYRRFYDGHWYYETIIPSIISELETNIKRLEEINRYMILGAQGLSNI